jgi:branched-chain amino acid transport system permease protein
MREYLANFGTWYLILLGALSIAIVLIMPQGLWGLWGKYVSLGLLPIGHTAVGNDAKHLVHSDLAKERATAPQTG